jgi:hypothetical protein
MIRRVVLACLRVALNCGSGRSHSTLLYQSRGEEWKALESPDDEVLAVADKTIAAQVKKSGLPKKTDLRLIWWTPKVHQWIDSNTAILYASLVEEPQEKGQDSPSPPISFSL